MQRKSNYSKGSVTQVLERPNGNEKDSEHVNPHWGRENYSFSGTIMVLMCLRILIKLPKYSNLIHLSHLLIVWNFGVIQSLAKITPNVYKIQRWRRKMNCRLMAYNAVFCPFLVVHFYMACTHFDCSLTTPLLDMFVYRTLSFSQYAALLPTLTMKATLIASCWILFQAILAVYFPGPIGYPHIVLYLVTELLERGY
jgi:hypothetical protein